MEIIASKSDVFTSYFEQFCNVYIIGVQKLTVLKSAVVFVVFITMVLVVFFSF